MTPQFHETFDGRARLIEAVYQLLFCCIDVSLIGVDEALLLVRCRVTRKSDRNATDDQREAENRLECLLVKGREYRKGIYWFEISGFLEDVHELLGGLLDAAGRVHIFRLFIVTRDIHEVVVGE